MNNWQKRLVETYGGGDYAHVTTLEEAKDVGDTLFTFLFIELSESEGCDSEDEALGRVVTATSQLIELQHALEW